MEAVSNVNIGVDLARFDRRTRVKEAIASDSVRAVPVVTPRAVSGVKLGLNPAAVFLFMFFMSGILFVVFSYAQLSAINRENAQTLKLLNAAIKEQGVLTAEMESRIKLDEISEIATEQLGFIKLDRRQVIYIDMSGKEKVEVLAEPSLKDKIVDSITGIFD